MSLTIREFNFLFALQAVQFENQPPKIRAKSCALLSTEGFRIAGGLGNGRLGNAISFVFDCLFEGILLWLFGIDESSVG
jgi:hypothetical protein